MASPWCSSSCTALEYSTDFWNATGAAMEIEGDELVKTLKGPMHWSCRQDAEERGSYKAEVRETPWPLEAVATKS